MGTRQPCHCFASPEGGLLLRKWLLFRRWPHRRLLLLLLLLPVRGLLLRRWPGWARLEGEPAEGVGPAVG